jgi:S-sulfo-L-cysteine synthase (O-acetyl-L-serine-dependent)
LADDDRWVLTEERAMGVLDAIGNTPLVELTNLPGKPKAVRILAKLEGANPGGSVKDRPALRMLEAAEACGELTRQQTILEATSGNTGIALAMIGAAKGYRVMLCMSAGVSRERRAVLEALGAEVVLTSAHEGTDGAIRRVRDMAARHPERYYLPDQYSNPNNVLAHYETTGPEILDQAQGDIDVFVAGMGTSGTLMGISRYLKERLPRVRVVGVEPPIGHRILGLKNMHEAIRPRIYDPSQLDEQLTVVDQDAFHMTRLLASSEGVFVGMSSGAAVAGAVQVARRMTRGTIVALLPDRGDRYLSTGVFAQPAAQSQSRVA